MEMNLISTITMIVFIMNIIVGVSNHLTMQYAIALPHSSTYDNFTYMNYNTTDMDESVEYILTDPSLERSKPALQSLWDIVNGVPIFVDRTATIVQAPTEIRTLFTASSYIIIYGIYIVFLVELFRPS